MSGLLLPCSRLRTTSLRVNPSFCRGFSTASPSSGELLATIPPPIGSPAFAFRTRTYKLHLPPSATHLCLPTSYLSASRQHIHILKLYRRARSRATIPTHPRLTSISGGCLRMVRNASIQRRIRRLENETPDCGFAPRARKTGTYTACQSQER
jgi:hypothetical protein